MEGWGRKDVQARKVQRQRLGGCKQDGGMEVVKFRWSLEPAQG